ncbi:MAG TPA: helix-turn-helix domain-containing protein [Rhizomicrobium sp.]|jgi:AcrR family transcriptional regulator
MAVAGEQSVQRRARARSAARSAILDAARRVAARQGARNLSLRAAAAEAGFAPAALYGYFQNKDELLIALAAEDLSVIGRAMRAAAETCGSASPLAAASTAALSLLEHTETFAAASQALPQAAGTSEPERLFNGRLIAALTILSNATGRDTQDRVAQIDVVLLAAALTGLAVFARAGRLVALGYSTEEAIARLDARFSHSI